jgi:hypothetical protein
MIHAVLSFGRRGHRRSVVLGDRTLGNPGRRNLRLPLPLPAALRDRLLLGSKVRLELQITSTPDSAPDCRGPATTVLKLRTRVVRVLAALQSRAG